jgi:hypothetical protein
MTNGTIRGWVSRPGRSLPPGKTRYSLYRRLGGSQGRSGQVRKISPPTGIRSPTVQPVAQSLYRLSYRAHCSNGVTKKTRRTCTPKCYLAKYIFRESFLVLQWTVKNVSMSLGQVQTDFLYLTYTIKQEISHMYFPVYFYLGSQITAINFLVLGQKAWDVIIRFKRTKACVSASVYVAVTNTWLMQKGPNVRLHCHECGEMLLLALLLLSVLLLPTLSRVICTYLRRRWDLRWRSWGKIKGTLWK